MTPWWWAIDAYLFVTALAVLFVVGGNRGRRSD